MVRAGPEGVSQENILSWFTDPELVIPYLERQVQATYWGGEAIPVVFPVTIHMVAITAAYLGCPYRIIGSSNSSWGDPIMEDWETRPRFAFDPNNEWCSFPNACLKQRRSEQQVATTSGFQTSTGRAKSWHSSEAASDSRSI